MVRSTVHILLAIVILFSGTGFTINLHFCHDQVKEIAWMAPIEQCTVQGEEPPPCCMDSKDGTDNTCRDASIPVKTTEAFIISHIPIGFEENFQTEPHRFAEGNFPFHIYKLHKSGTSPGSWKLPGIPGTDMSMIQAFLL